MGAIQGESEGGLKTCQQRPCAACGLFASRLISFLLPVVLLGAPSVAYACITRIEITSVESPTFEGKRFGRTGQYEKLRGTAHGEVEPNHLLNAVITDIELAPKNASGSVEYSMDIYILSPVRQKKGNQMLFMEVNNRGNKLFGAFNEGLVTNDPTTAADAGDGFLMTRGYSIVWAGWDPLASAGNHRLTLTAPVATDNGDITGPSYEYIDFDNATTMSHGLIYPAATLDQNTASLTVKPFLNDTPVVIPAALRVTAPQGQLRAEPPRRTPVSPASDSTHM